MHKAVEVLHELEDSGARALVTSDHGHAAVQPIRAQTKLEAVAVTSYGDFLPARPTLPPPPSFLEPLAPYPDTEAFLDILKSSRPIPQVPRALDDTALLQYTSGTCRWPKLERGG
jgi:long-chain acyl-CoA synthetase